MTEDYKTIEHTSAPKTPPMPPDPVRLVASARFYTETIMIPPGITSRDLPGFLEGEVEELSLFPIESTSWGYLENANRKTGASVLIYAAFREHVNGATDPAFARRYAVLPGFAALLGRSWRKPTWVVLLEPECVTLLRMVPKSAMPDFVKSIYGVRLDENPDTAWKVREELLASAPFDSSMERAEEGFIRVAGPVVDRRGSVVFPLERQRLPHDAWKRYGNGKITSESELLAADVRDLQFLAEERHRRRAVRQLRLFMRSAALVLIALGVFQYLYLKKRAETDQLTAQVKAQRPAVQALKDQESRAKSASRFAGRPLELFDWLSAVNVARPDSIYFTTAYADREARLGFSGEAPSVSVVNQYIDGLKASDRIESVEIKEMASANKGVNFTLQVKVNPVSESNLPETQEQPEDEA